MFISRVMQRSRQFDLTTARILTFHCCIAFFIPETHLDCGDCGRCGAEMLHRDKSSEMVVKCKGLIKWHESDKNRLVLFANYEACFFCNWNNVIDSTAGHGRKKTSLLTDKKKWHAYQFNSFVVHTRSLIDLLIYFIKIKVVSRNSVLTDGDNFYFFVMKKLPYYEYMCI